MLPRYSDSHFHMYTEPETVCGYIDRMRALGLERLGLMVLTCSRGRLRAYNNFTGLKTKLACKDFPLYLFGGMNHEDYFKGIPYEKQAEAMLDIGFDGIKFLDMKPSIYKIIGSGVGRREYYRLFELLEAKQTPVVMHCADPETFWDKSKMRPDEIEKGWWYGDGTYPSYDDIYREVFSVLDRHPNLNVVLAHFFFLSNNYEEAVRVMETYPGVKFDITPGWEMYVGFSRDIDKWHDFFMKYADRIIYGTDSTDEMGSHQDEIDLNNVVSFALTHDRSEYVMPIFGPTVRGLELDEKTIEKISLKNFTRYFGAEPKVINRYMLSEAADYLRSLLRGKPGAEEYIEKLKGL